MAIEIVELISGRHDGAVIAASGAVVTLATERHDGGVTLSEYRQRHGEPRKFDLAVVYLAWHLRRFTIIEGIWPNPAPTFGNELTATAGAR